MPLTHVFKKISDTWTDKQRCHISEISEYSTDVRHISGAENTVVDELTRVAAVIEGVSPQQLALAQNLCDDSRKLGDKLSTHASLRIEKVPFDEGKVLLLCDLASEKCHSVIPVSYAIAFSTLCISLPILVSRQLDG